jgi:phage shock protein B
MAEDVFLPVVICAMLFIGLPWILFHYVTQWKKAGSLTVEDENLLDELHDTARRLDERMRSIERIIAADNPNWRPDGDR